MNYDRFRLAVTIQAIGIALTPLIFTWSITKEYTLVTSVSLVFIWIFQVSFLIYYVRKTNRELAGFLQSLEHKDYTRKYSEERGEKTFKEVYKAFNQISKAVKQAKIEKESEHHYFLYTIQHVGIGLISFDEKTNKEFDLEKDFKEDKFRDFLKLANITDNQKRETVLDNLGLLKNDYLVNAGVLMFCDKISKFFLQGKVTCVLFEGTSSNIIDKKEFNSDLISNYENAYNFIISKLNTKYIIERYRTEKFELPKNAIREALINAFIHRDYFSNGHIQINIFIDKIEISSPGGLIKGLKKEDLGKISLSRNKLLFDLLSRTSYVEKAGTGIKRIRDSMKEYNLNVKFESTGFFTVTFERENIGRTMKKNVEQIIEDQPKTSQKPAKEERKKLILQAIKEKTFTKRRFAEKIRVNKSTIELDLKELKKESKIKRIGPAQGGSWEVLEIEK